MNLPHYLSEGLYAFSNLYLRKKTPTIIYAPGRVGSMSLIKNLRQAGVYSFKVESLLSEPRGASRFCKKHIVDAKLPANIITLVRDPLAIMCTYYYSKAIKGWIKEATEAHARNDVPALQKIFIDSCLRTDRLDQHLYWYERDWEPSLGFSIFDYPFDTATQHSHFFHETYNVLVLRTELDDTKKQLELGSFLQNDKINLTRENIRTEKPGGETYQEFKDTLQVPPDLLEKIYTAPYVTHFFSPTEITSLCEKWS